jgi:superfamily II DNA/RNA helicase
VRERTVRLVIATDAACEGLNLQTLGTLINIDGCSSDTEPSMDRSFGE